MNAAQDTREIVIRIGVRRRMGRKWISPEETLLMALRTLRTEGYEVDVFLRGTWSRCNGGRPTIMNHSLNEHWRAQGQGIQILGSPVLPNGDWHPCVGRKPAPELVLLGVRNAA
jgi:hypothetical protein